MNEGFSIGRGVELENPPNVGNVDTSGHNVGASKNTWEKIFQ